MSRKSDNAIIYKLIRYQDASAIGLAFTESFGKVKLFIPKAYTKRGGVMSFVPGVLDFNHKESTDLSKYYGFAQNREYFHFIDVHDILLRLHLVFETVDILYGVDQSDERLWRLILKYSEENYRKLTPYILHHILSESGFGTDYSACCMCGGEADEGLICAEGLVCSYCTAPAESMKVSKSSLFFLKNISNNRIFKNIKIARNEELELIKLLSMLAEKAADTKLRSTATLLRLI